MPTELLFCEAAPATEADGGTGVRTILEVVVFPRPNFATFLTLHSVTRKLLIASTDRDVLPTMGLVTITSNEAVMGNGMVDDMGYLRFTTQAGNFVSKLLGLECGKEAKLCKPLKVRFCESRLFVDWVRWI
ncbi:hypothetical protein CEP54_014260 [Fusarium duplospermum]|uniref:Uncharacterized protein n=1 Tax=Fusarium duplospermum TaxID=1325734 RepID=A0A428NX79_9HYPO|nr:hypothetical protein CEP54_014260 [Fusarium duplospermum]